MRRRPSTTPDRTGSAMHPRSAAPRRAGRAEVGQQRVHRYDARSRLAASWHNDAGDGWATDEHVRVDDRTDGRQPGLHHLRRIGCDGDLRQHRTGREALCIRDRPLPGEPVVQKSVNSAFIGTTLEADLRRRGITTLVMVGLQTNMCVSTTARMAGNLGFTTYVVSDATATFDNTGPDGKRYASEIGRSPESRSCRSRSTARSSVRRSKPTCGVVA